MRAGFAAAQVLEHQHNIVAEMATDVLVLFMFGIGTSGEHLTGLGDALAAVAASVVDVGPLGQDHSGGPASATASDSMPSADCSPRLPNSLHQEDVDGHGLWSPELPAPEVALLPRDVFFAETER